MKRIKFGTKEINVKNDSLERIVAEALASQELTREEVSTMASVSLSTAGKILSALDECGFTDLKYSKENRFGHPSKIHAFRDEICLLVLDFSSSTYFAHFVFGKASRITTERHQYDPSLSFENNVTAFLSRIGLKASTMSHAVSAICTVIIDESKNDYTHINQTSAYLPRASDMSLINAYCARFFGTMPHLNLTRSEAITCAARYNLLGAHRDINIAYVGISNTLNALYIPRLSATVRPNINELIFDNTTVLRDMNEASHDTKSLAVLITRIVNFISCAYPTDEFLIETDLTRFQNLDKKVDLIFKSFELPTPKMRFVEAEPSAQAIGASVELLKTIICYRIKGT